MPRLPVLFLLVILAAALTGCETWTALRKDLHTAGRHIEDGINNVNHSITNPDR